MQALRASDDTLELSIDGRGVRITSLTRVLWPQTGTSKRDLLILF